MEANYKGTRIFDWIPEQEIRDLITSYEAKSRPVPAERVAVGGGETNELSDLYNNIEVLHLTNVDVTSSFTDTGKNFFCFVNRILIVLIHLFNRKQRRKRCRTTNTCSKEQKYQQQ